MKKIVQGDKEMKIVGTVMFVVFVLFGLFCLFVWGK